MVRIQSRFLTVRTGIATIAIAATLLLAGMVFGQAAQSPKFYPDDPVDADPKPVAVGDIPKVDIYNLYDYFYQTVRAGRQTSATAQGINTLGEVPDSAWFTNRHGSRRMTRDELQRGPGDGNAPQPPFLIVGAKTEGITPGFRMRDAAGRLFFVKPDPPDNPGLISAADVMGSKFFHAIGYNTPENYIVRIKRSDWSIDPKARVSLPSNLSRRMSEKDMGEILDKAAILPDGSMRVIASFGIAGKGIGPFRYEGTRPDDPNDLVPHEDRRDLRGLYVFCAWLNHTDAKAANSYNTLATEDGVTFVKHYLIDFGSAFGSDGDRSKDARFGHEYQIPVSAGPVLRQIRTLGFAPYDWEKAHYPDPKKAGRIEATAFDPETWVPNYPNPAFLRRQLEDEYWAAKIVMSFTDEDIRALVETGQYSDSRTTDYVAKTLAGRRDKIGRAYFSKVLPLEDFEIRDGKLVFEDLAVRHGFAAARQYQISWTTFDKRRDAASPRATIADANSFELPKQFTSLPDGGYISAVIHPAPAAGDAAGGTGKSITVYLRKNGATAQVVGIERN
ncbi:MAG: hypothetical protein LBP68_06000 [Acidobacteriota bacterium]|jgi:hypothetical protein|nr:hypothetical protein [Acidobacteriota bacterium]